MDATMGDAFGGNLISSTAEHIGRQLAFSLAAPAVSNDNFHDYIMIEDLLQDMATNDDGCGDSDEDAAMNDPVSAKFMAEIAYCLDDDILFGNSRWLENFREMKQAATDALYKGCPKHWTVLPFDLQMLMLKAQHG